MTLASIAASYALATARTINVPPQPHPAWTVLRIPQDVDPGADSRYAGLRIRDDDGHDVPYVLDPQCASATSHRASLSGTGFVEGRYTETLIDAGRSGDLYDAIVVDTPKSTFFTRTEVAISDDRETWRILRSDALIYRVGASSDPGSQTIALTPSRARWIRLRVLDPREAFPLNGVALGSATPASAQRDVPLALGAISTRRAKHETIVKVDLGSEHTQLSRLQFSTTRREFSRPVRVESSSDGLTFSTIADGTIARFEHGAASLQLATDNNGARYLRVHVANGDDPPLPGLGVRAFGPARMLVFIAEPARRYSLIMIPGKTAPDYDLPQILAHDNPRRLLEAHVSGPLTIAAPHPAAAKREPPAYLFTVAFAAAMAVMAAVTIRALKRY